MEMILGSGFAWYASCVLCTLFGVLLLVTALMNYFQRFRDRGGQRFIYEMDNVAGALVGIRNFSIVEGTLCLVAGLACLSAWSIAPGMLLLTVLGLLLGAVYFILLVQYADHVAIKTQAVSYSVIGICLLLLAVWRMLGADLFLQDSGLRTTSIVGMVVLLLLLFLGGMRMNSRAAMLKPTFDRFHLIMQYTGSEPSSKVKLNPDWEWERGAIAPVGFGEPTFGGHYSWEENRPLKRKETEQL